MKMQFDKSGLRFFFLTAALRGRPPALSRIVERKRPPPRGPRSARKPDPRAGWGVEPTPAGEAIAAIWRSIHVRWPFLTASDYILMPDHVHLLLLVDYRRAPGDFDLLGWWLGFRRAAAQRAAPLARCAPELFWEDKYWLQLLNAGRPLAAVRRYIKMNPARKVWKDRHPDFFALHSRFRHPVLSPNLHWSAIGNLTLLSSPFLFPVVLTRRKPLEEHASAIADILDRAKRGAIPVSGFLSPAEKRVFELLRAEPDTRWIKTVPHALPPRFDPSVEDSRFLAEGRQLVLSSFPGIPAFPVLRENCLAMNARTAQMCEKATGARPTPGPGAPNPKGGRWGLTEHKKTASANRCGQKKSWQRATLPPPSEAVPSPRRVLTSVFGMGTGIALALWSPGKRECIEHTGRTEPLDEVASGSAVFRRRNRATNKRSSLTAD